MKKLCLIPLVLATTTLFTANAEARLVKIISAYNGNCLEYTGYKDDTAAKRSCTNDNSANFIWDLQSNYDGYGGGIEGSTYRIISTLKDGCLDNLMGSDYVGYWSSCNGDRNQSWHINGTSYNPGSIESAVISSTRICLDQGKSNGKTYSWRCHGADNQRWLIQDVY